MVLHRPLWQRSACRSPPSDRASPAHPSPGPRPCPNAPSCTAPAVHELDWGAVGQIRNGVGVAVLHVFDVMS